MATTDKSAEFFVKYYRNLIVLLSSVIEECDKLGGSKSFDKLSNNICDNVTAGDYDDILYELYQKWSPRLNHKPEPEIQLLAKYYVDCMTCYLTNYINPKRV